MLLNTSAVFFLFFFVSVSKMHLKQKKWWCQRACLSVLAAVTTERGWALLWPVASVWRWGNIQYFEILGLNLIKKRLLRYFNFPDFVWAVLQCFSRINMWYYEAEVTSDSRVEVKWEEWGLQHMGMSQSPRGRLWGTICHTLMKTIKLTRTLTVICSCSFRSGSLFFLTGYPNQNQ